MITRTLAVLALTFAAVPAAAQTVDRPAQPVVVTQGEATVTRAPDRAWLTVAADGRDARAADARRIGAEAMTNVQAALEAAGVAADAIRTTGYSLTPEMEWNNGRGTVKGYVAHNQIEVRIDDLTKLGAIIDAADNIRSATISISGPRFDLKDREGAEREALGLAVQAALARAEAIAAGAKRTLGDVVRIDDQNMGAPPPRPMFMAAERAVAKDATTPITPGEINIDARVSLTVELK